MVPPPSGFCRAGRHCPRCSAAEPDPGITTCRRCGETLLELLRHQNCPKCGAPSGELDRCHECGVPLVVIGPPLEECVPAGTSTEELRPVLLLRGGRLGPGLARMAGLPLMAGHGEETEPAHAATTLSGLNLTTDPEQMSGVPKDHVKLGVGESVTVYVRGVDEDGKWCPLPPGLMMRWRSDRELKLEPPTGEKVTAMLLRAPKVSALATVRTTVGKKRLSRLFTVERK